MRRPCQPFRPALSEFIREAVRSSSGVRPEDRQLGRRHRSRRRDEAWPKTWSSAGHVDSSDQRTRHPPRGALRSKRRGEGQAGAKSGHRRRHRRLLHRGLLVHILQNSGGSDRGRKRSPRRGANAEPRRADARPPPSLDLRGVLKNGFTRLAGGLSVERCGRLRLSSVADAQSAPSSPKPSTKSLPTQTNKSVLQHPPRGVEAGPQNS